MFGEYEILDKITKENNSEEFFETMKKYYRGEKVSGPCPRNIDNLMFYEIDNNEVRVSKGHIYRERPSSVIISDNNENEEQIFKVKSKLEREMKKFELKLIEKGK